MSKYIFVTGLHRAGTHSFAEAKAAELNLPFIEELNIRFNDMSLMYKLFDKHPDGFICHCPGLAHKCLEISRIKNSKIYWVERNVYDIVTSMKNVAMRKMSWDIKDSFKSEFPDDPLWIKIVNKEIVYDGSTDIYDGCTQYYLFIIRLKQYFYDKYFKDIAEKIITEEQNYFDAGKSVSIKYPLKDVQIERVRNFDKSLRLH